MFSFFRSSLYSLRKCRHIFNTNYRLYRKKGSSLPPTLSITFEQNLQTLDDAIKRKDRSAANTAARKVETFNSEHFKKGFLSYTSELLVALVLALAVATVVRQSWFELYEIPTGSMRPTFREKDHLTVSKLPFGINFPLQTAHLYFDPSLVQRSSVVIFTGDQIPYIDQYTTYFGILPYKKRYIKRMIGKPGDTLYFYGGQIYGFDEKGQEIKELIDSSYMRGLEHIPFLTFEGMISAPTGGDRLIFKQMNQPVGQLVLKGGNFQGEIFNGTSWVKDNPAEARTAHESITTLSDFWGMRNFAMARLLTREQLEKLPNVDLSGLDKGVLYLELRHHPSLTFPKPNLNRNLYSMMVLLTPQTAIIPLQQEELDLLMDSMYTARFVVKDGQAYSYSLENEPRHKNSLSLPKVSDGTYEFYYGKAFKVGLGGFTSELPTDHPLYSHNPADIQKLYNYGIEIDRALPYPGQPLHFPQRYAYFRNGDLYLLGAPILKKESPTLQRFVEQEKAREDKSSSNQPYTAFQDYGPPLLEDGSLDKEFIKKFGVRIPDRYYFALGDNHAMSSDSRIFGFVPEDNLQGAPSLIIWPPGDRLGAPMQKPYPIFNIPRLIVWGLFACIVLGWILWQHRQNKKREWTKR